MAVCLFMFECVCGAYVRACARACVCACVRVFVHMYIYVYGYTRIFLQVCVYIYTCVYLHFSPSSTQTLSEPAGFSVVALGRSPSRGAEVVKEMAARGGGQHEFISCDAFSLGNLAKSAAAIRATRPMIDVLVLSQV